jgi:hypothetical protein
MWVYDIVNRIFTFSVSVVLEERTMGVACEELHQVDVVLHD